jgi:hypothetical protein
MMSAAGSVAGHNKLSHKDLRPHRWTSWIPKFFLSINIILRVEAKRMYAVTGAITAVHSRKWNNCDMGVLRARWTNYYARA